MEPRYFAYQYLEDFYLALRNKFYDSVGKPNLLMYTVEGALELSAQDGKLMKRFPTLDVWIISALNN